MRSETVILNASPLIGLYRAGLEHILSRLWKEILVPEAVWREVTAAGKNDAAATGLQQAVWAQRVPPVDIPPLVGAWDLGAGESAVLALANQMPSARVVLDDAQARKCAQTMGVRLSGTGGIMVFAKRQGLINSVSEALSCLAAVGFRLSPHIAAQLKTLAGE